MSLSAQRKIWFAFQTDDGPLVFPSYSVNRHPTLSHCNINICFIHSRIAFRVRIIKHNPFNMYCMNWLIYWYFHRLNLHLWFEYVKFALISFRFRIFWPYTTHSTTFVFKSRSCGCSLSNSRAFEFVWPYKPDFAVDSMHKETMCAELLKHNMTHSSE